MNFLRTELKNLMDETASETGKQNKLITFEATVISGFEHQAVDEIKEKLKLKTSSIFRIRGHIFFNASADDYETKVLKLRSVDNLFMVIHNFGSVKFNRNDKTADMELIKSFAKDVDWKGTLPLWATLVKYNGTLFPDKPSKPPVASTVVNDTCPPAASTVVNDTCPPAAVASETPSNSAAPTTPASDETATDSGVEELNVNLPDVVVLTEGSPIDVPKQMVDENDDGGGDDGFNTATNLVEDGSDDFLSCSSGNDDENLDQEKVETCQRNVENLKSEKIDKIGDLQDEQETVLMSVPEVAIDSAALPEADIPASDPQEKTETVEEVENNPVTDPEVEEGSSETSPSELDDASVPTPEEMSKDLNGVEKASVGTVANKRKGQRPDRRGRKDDGKPKRELKPYVNDGILKFRATCVRNGVQHSFTSMEAAWDFGGTLNDTFFWTVDLTRFDLNAVLVIEHDMVYVTAALTGESLHRRNITHFGPTTLRATTCFHLLYMAEPVPGDIIVDPMCGGGSIPIEGALAFPSTFHLGGDHHERAFERLKGNLKSPANINLKIDGFGWDAGRLPLKDNSVDVIVTDLPYGIRIGRKKDNRPFYSRALKEFARVVRGGVGRAVLMTADDAALTKAVRDNDENWKLIRSLKISHGGLKAVAFLLIRKRI